MKCAICGEDKASTYERPITLGAPGEAQTQPICDGCYLEKLTNKDKNLLDK